MTDTILVLVKDAEDSVEEAYFRTPEGAVEYLKGKYPETIKTNKVRITKITKEHLDDESVEIDYELTLIVPELIGHSIYNYFLFPAPLRG